jgi:hypothetical protein
VQNIRFEKDSRRSGETGCLGNDNVKERKLKMKNIRLGRRYFIPLFVVAALLMLGDVFAASSKSKVSILVKDRSEKSDDKGEDEVEKESSITETAFQSETEIVTLTLKIKNGGDLPLTGQLEWCFIYDYSSGKHKDSRDRVPAEAVAATFSPGKKKVTLEPDSVLEEIVISDPFRYEEKTVDTENYNNGYTTSYDYETGNIYKGYLVLFTVDGEVVAMKSNSSRYIKDEWIEKCRYTK